MLDRVLAYVDAATPARLVDRRTQQEITDFDPAQPNPNAVLERSARTPFPLASYEWGVTYAGMLSAAEATGDSRFRDFVASRFTVIAHALPSLNAPPAGGGPAFRNPLRGLIAPQRLDDIGAMDAALIKAKRAGVGPAPPGPGAAARAFGAAPAARGAPARRPRPRGAGADDVPR